MNILDIEIVNNRLIRCFMKQLNGDNLEISGDTGTGKTTAISALWDIMEKRADGLSHGQKKGSIRIKVGDDSKFIVATREVTPKTSSITIMDSDGKSVSISDFKQMISDLSVNPHQICSMKPKQRTETLLKSADLGGFDLLKADAELVKLEADRLTAFRASEALKTGPAPEKADSVSLADLMNQKNAADKVNQENQKVRIQFKIYQEEFESLKNQEKELLESLARVRDKIQTNQMRIKSVQEEVSKLKDIDTAPIVSAISMAEQTNRKASQYEAWEANNAKYQASVSKHSKLDGQVKDLVAKRKSAMDNAKWPLEGLEIKDGDIYYNGCLFDNLGESETMLVCAALAISDIKSHPIRVVRMDGVESMSKKDYDMLKALFNGHGIQVLATRVSRGDVLENEIVIVDGQYKETEVA